MQKIMFEDEAVELQLTYDEGVVFATVLVDGTSVLTRQYDDYADLLSDVTLELFDVRVRPRGHIAEQLASTVAGAVADWATER